MIRILFCFMFFLTASAVYGQNAIFGWGNNSSGQSGLFETEKQIIDFDAGPYSSCYVLDNGEVNCLGCANPLENFKQCEPRLTPKGWVMKYGGLRTTEKPFTTISSSFGATCGINSDGEIECWGCEPNRQNFQCNIPEKAKKIKAAIPKNPLNGLRTLDSAEMHSCAVLKDGSVSCWGCEQSHNFGQCNPPKLENAIGVSTGYKHSCAVLNNGSVNCWGDNTLNELNIPSDIGNVTRISSAHGYNAIKNMKNELHVWGLYAPKICRDANSKGCIPKNNVKTLSASDDYLCVIYNDNSIICEKSEIDFKENNKYRLAGLKEREKYDWLDNIQIKGVSVDNGVTTVLTDIKSIESFKAHLPKNKRIMSESEYMQNRTHIEQNKSFNKAKYDFQNFIGIKFIEIQSGHFKMGSCDGWIHCILTGYSIDDSMHDFEMPLHKVNIDYNFQMGISEITIGQFKNYIQDKNLNINDFVGVTFGADYYPMTMISWYDAQNFVKWLNEKKPYDDTAIYRLPTEAEWEYSARAGTKTITWQGNRLDGSNLANCIDCIELEEPGILPVGSFPSNPWGLYDMMGNVDEWVQDCIVEENGYRGVPLDGSALEKSNCTYRVARGGSWEYSSGTLRSAWRDFYTPESKTWEQGFRIVRDIK